MSYETGYSTCDIETEIDEWYRSVKPNYEQKPITTKMLYDRREAVNRTAKVASSNSFSDDDHSGENKPVVVLENASGSFVKDLRSSIDKPLPALPNADGPYFEYMFVDAGEDDEEVFRAHSKSMAHFKKCSSVSPISVAGLDHDDASLPDEMPGTPTTFGYDSKYFGYDGVPIKQEGLTPIFPTFPVVDSNGNPPFILSPTNSNTPPIPSQPSVSLAAVNVVPVSTVLTHNHVAAVPAATLPSNTSQAGLVDATEGFYEAFVAEESPSPYHVPDISEGGFSNVREGAEAFPEQWKDLKVSPEVDATYKRAAAKSRAEELALSTSAPVKPVLLPKSQLAKAARGCDAGCSHVHRATFTPQLTARSGFSDEALKQINGTKRPAQDLITNKDLEIVEHDDDEDEQFEERQSTKRARLTAESTMDADVIYDDCLPITPSLKHKSSSRSISSITLGLGKFSDIQDGYPGQFRALEAPAHISHPKYMSGGPSEVLFGDQAHANGFFLHTRFQPGGLSPSSQYNLYTGPAPSPTSPMGLAIALADDLTDAAAASTRRTKDQEALRRETHFECAVALLEGVAVGEYRYYQGHSSVEEYVAGGVCVCWKECFCTDMCGRYADMLCPCAEFLAFDSE